MNIFLFNILLVPASSFIITSRTGRAVTCSYYKESQSHVFSIRPKKSSTHCLYAINDYNSIDSGSISSSNSFDINTCTILAGYAFEAYNEPTVGKLALGQDGTSIRFTSTEFINLVFEGVLLMGLEKASILRGEQANQLFLEKLTTGSMPDPYILIAAHDIRPNTERRVIDRVIDTAMSSTKQNTYDPAWQETFFLYIRNKSSAFLNITMADKNIFSEDSCLGTAELAISDLETASSDSILPLKVPIPLYLPKKRGWFDFDFSNNNSKNKKRIRTSTCNADFKFIPWQKYSSSTSPTMNSTAITSRVSSLPKGASPGADWSTLLRELLSKRIVNYGAEAANRGPERSQALHDLRLHQVCSIDNAETDTQAGIFLDQQSRQVVVSFRGTEQTKIKDILTDINLIQSPFFGDTEGGILKEARFHSGFLRAYFSVRSAVLQILEILLTTDCEIDDSKIGNRWSIFITGHSLGGALATLLTFDLEVLRQKEGELINYQNIPHLLVSTQQFRQRLAETPVITYTFGAPRVGNQYFANIFTSLLSKQQQQQASQLSKFFRVVNKEDIVARLPRSSQINRIINYEHVGKTVLVDDSSSNTRIWIEGESQGSCPLQDLSPFMLANSQIVTPESQLQEWDQALASAFESNVNSIFSTLKSSVTSASSVVPIEALQQSNFTNILDAYQRDILGTAKSFKPTLLREKLSSVKLGSVNGVDLDEIKAVVESFAWDLASGVDQQFLEREMAILRSIVDGRALDHHLEPSYFAALKKVVLKQQETSHASI